MQIWLIRHGTTAANRERRFQGRLDYPLSPQGRREARLLAERVKSLAPDLLLSSDLQRAWETAQIIAQATGLIVRPLPLLRECSWGVAEGKTLEEIYTIYPSLRAAEAAQISAEFFGGESKKRLLARAGLVLRLLSRRFAHRRRVVLVSHGRFINALLACSLGLSADQFWPFAPAPASLSMISCEEERREYRLELFNDRCHLRSGEK